MTRFPPSGTRATLTAVMSAWLTLGALSFAGQSVPPATGQTEDEEPAPLVIKEVGGRLVVLGERVVVVADPDEPVHSTSIATKTDTPLLETPRSVSVVDRQTLDDLLAVNITQAHDYTLGFSTADERGPGFDRGFPVGFYDLRRDGLRTYSWSVREPAALDRIQYLRGPAAVLYGDGSPGGLVNLVLKKPLPTPRYEASLNVGELGFRRFTADATGPLSEGGHARYRLVAAAEGLENGFDNGESRVSVLPMLSFDLGPKTTLHLDGEYYDQRGRGYRHTLPATRDAQRGDFSAIPWNLNMASPDDSWRGWNTSGGMRLDTQLSKGSSLHVAGRFTKIDGDLGVQILLGLAPDGRTARRGLYREKSVWHEYQSDAFALFSATTGAVRHRIVLGVEAGLSTVDSSIGIGLAPSLDIYAPVYGPRPAEPPLAPSGNDMARLGAYVQDQLAFGKRWTLVPALRWSRLRLEDHAPAATQSGSPVTKDTAVTPSAGLVFMTRPWLSCYASYGKGFEAPTPGQFLQDGRALAPVESRSIEAGVKADLLGRRLNVTLAGFGIRQTHVAEADPGGFYRQIGEGRSKGLEIEAVGSPARGLVVRAGFAWTRTEITRDTAGFTGNALPNAPGEKANLWTRYHFSGGPLSRLALAAGLVHVSERFTSRANAVRLPPYTRFDATAFYEVAGRRLVIAVSAENLANARYVTSGAGSVFWAGRPRRLAANLRGAF